jgi:hypothetical protein
MSILAPWSANLCFWSVIALVFLGRGRNQLAFWLSLGGLLLAFSPLFYFPLDLRDGYYFWCWSLNVIVIVAAVGLRAPAPVVSATEAEQ